VVTRQLCLPLRGQPSPCSTVLPQEAAVVSRQLCLPLRGQPSPCNTMPPEAAVLSRQLCLPLRGQLRRSGLSRPPPGSIRFLPRASARCRRLCLPLRGQPRRSGLPRPPPGAVSTILPLRAWLIALAAAFILTRRFRKQRFARSMRHLSVVPDLFKHRATPARAGKGAGSIRRPYTSSERCGATPSCRMGSSTVQPQCARGRGPAASVGRTCLASVAAPCRRARWGYLQGGHQRVRKGQQRKQALHHLRAMQRHAPVPEVANYGAAISGCGSSSSASRLCLSYVRCRAKPSCRVCLLTVLPSACAEGPAAPAAGSVQALGSRWYVRKGHRIGSVAAPCHRAGRFTYRMAPVRAEGWTCSGRRPPHSS